MRFNLSPIGIFELGKETLNRKEFIQRYQWLVVVIATDCLTFSSDSWVFIYEKVEDMFFLMTWHILSQEEIKVRLFR